MHETHWNIHPQDYFTAPGLTTLLFHNTYPEGHQGGIELIQHGERVATNGDLRLEPIPGQWSAPLPAAGPREVNRERSAIRIPLHFKDANARCAIRVQAERHALRLSVDLEDPLPVDWVGRLGFNLELFPDAYIGKTFHLGQTFDIFPAQANGPVTAFSDDFSRPLPLATGSQLVIAPEDPLRKLTITQTQGEMALLDGRTFVHSGWFVVRAVIPASATHNALEWMITPNSVAAWRRPPVIAISQVGYHPDQEKRAIIELEPRVKPLENVIVERIDAAGEIGDVATIQPDSWGDFLCYNYVIADFTAMREPGMYRLRYGDQSTPPFRISRDVYQRNVWQPTLETFLPVQMCHVEVRDRERIWHGVCHLDDAVQAPTSHIHFDGYRQRDTTDTSYAPYAHIPGLDRGGWHDAGDDDLAAGSQAQTTFVLALIRETFGVDTDQTTVRRAERQVILHRPDGTPDIIEQITHGVENLLSGYRAAGHSFTGIISGDIMQYATVADTGVLTDNRVYDPALQPPEVVGERSGKRDDRWAFTNHITALEYQVAGTLAAASRVLRGYEDALAEECLKTATAVWEYEQSHASVHMPHAYVPGNPQTQEILATIELFITTGETCFRDRLLALWPVILEQVAEVGWAVARALPQINDPTLTRQFREALQPYRATLETELARNPFGIPFHPHIWGIGWQIQWYAFQWYYLLQAFPDLFDREYLLRVVNYALGCHPGSNMSLVSGVGARSALSAYGYNRIDRSNIPGGNISGPALIKPDFMELKYPFPFLWQQAEYVIGGAATYIFCVLAADRLLNQ